MKDEKAMKASPAVKDPPTTPRHSGVVQKGEGAPASVVATAHDEASDRAIDATLEYSLSNAARHIQSLFRRKTA